MIQKMLYSVSAYNMVFEEYCSHWLSCLLLFSFKVQPGMYFQKIFFAVTSDRNDVSSRFFLHFAALEICNAMIYFLYTWPACKD